MPEATEKVPPLPREQLTMEQLRLLQDAVQNMPRDKRKKLRMQVEASKKAPPEGVAAEITREIDDLYARLLAAEQRDIEASRLTRLGAGAGAAVGGFIENRFNEAVNIFPNTVDLAKHEFEQVKNDPVNRGLRNIGAVGLGVGSLIVLNKLYNGITRLEQRGKVGKFFLRLFKVIGLVPLLSFGVNFLQRRVTVAQREKPKEEDKAETGQTLQEPRSEHTPAPVGMYDHPAHSSSGGPVAPSQNASGAAL